MTPVVSNQNFWGDLKVFWNGPVATVPKVVSKFFAGIILNTSNCSFLAVSYSKFKLPNNSGEENCHQTLS